METINELKARILSITNSVVPVSTHNKAIINAACKSLYERTGEILVNGSFIKV
jgi:hypothetical protein